MHLFYAFTFASSSSGGGRSLLVLSAAGHAVGPPVQYTTHVWVPTEHRGTCSGRPKSLKLALFKRSPSVPPSREGSWKGNPHCQRVFFYETSMTTVASVKSIPVFFASLGMLNLYRTALQAVYFEAATVYQWPRLKALSFVAATNGGSACVRVCAILGPRA